MKKQYMKPEIVSYHIQIANQLLAGSDPNSLTGTSNFNTGTKNGSTDTPLSRESDVWGADEER
jgi:hypothetical protein